MDKRYQIFISSTFADLIDERRAIQQAVLSLDHFPAGMELFPATNEDQWELIKSVIDDSDYYVIVVGGRYGSISPEGISYTEKEFDYALSEKKPVLAFVHADPDAIAQGKTDKDESARKKLLAFQTKVMTGRHVKKWDSPENLQAAVLQALVTETKRNPQDGWIRASQSADPALLVALKEELSQLKSTSEGPVADDLQQGSDTIALAVDYRDRFWNDLQRIVRLSWDDIFNIIGPVLLQEVTETTIKEHLSKATADFPDEDGKFVDASQSASLNAMQFQTVKVQFFALGLIERGNKKRGISDKNTYWRLTKLGEDYLMKLKALRRT